MCLIQVHRFPNQEKPTGGASSRSKPDADRDIPDLEPLLSRDESWGAGERLRGRVMDCHGHSALQHLISKDSCQQFCSFPSWICDLL